MFFIEMSTTHTIHMFLMDTNSIRLHLWRTRKEMINSPVNWGSLIIPHLLLKIDKQNRAKIPCPFRLTLLKMYHQVPMEKILWPALPILLKPPNLRQPEHIKKLPSSSVCYSLLCWSFTSPKINFKNKWIKVSRIEIKSLDLSSSFKLSQRKDKSWSKDS